jgi:putrescine transport system ATP-binding protein
VKTAPVLQAQDLAKRFRGEEVLRSVDLTLDAGTTLAILGHSGSGKTTLLKTLAGLEALDAGRVWLDGDEVTRVPPHLRRMVYLYQEPLLFPHLSVLDNVAFGRRVRGERRDEARERARGLLDRMGVGPHGDKRPHMLSGGQRQRVAFGRALIVEPRVLLLDEPFSALDGRTRRDMQALMLDVVRSTSLSTIFVTHDLKEALTVGDRFGTLDQGMLHLYSDRASFLGDPNVGALSELQFWQDLFQINREAAS